MLRHLNICSGTRLSHALADSLSCRTFVSGAHVVKQGSAPRSMYFILSGSAEVVIEHVPSPLPSAPGEQAVTTTPTTATLTKLTTLSDGQIFGHVDLLTKTAASSSVVVVDLLEAFELLSEAFDAICAEAPTSGLHAHAAHAILAVSARSLLTAVYALCTLRCRSPPSANS